MCVLVDMTHEGGGGSFDTYARAHVNVYAGANILHDRQLLRGEETVHILCCLSWHVYPGIFPPPRSVAYFHRRRGIVRFCDSGIHSNILCCDDLSDANYADLLGVRRVVNDGGAWRQ